MAVRTPRSAPTPCAPARVFSDGAGRTSSIMFGYGETISYEYDQRDRQVRELYSIPGVGAVADIGSAYDGADRRIARTDRTTSTLLVSWHFEDGRIAAIETGNGLRRAFSYDERGHLIAQETRERGGLVETSRVEREPASNPLRLELRGATTGGADGGALLAASGRVAREPGPAAGASSAGAPARAARCAATPGTSSAIARVQRRRLRLRRRARAPALRLPRRSRRVDGLPPRRGGLRHVARRRPAHVDRDGAASRAGDAIAWDMAGRPIAVTESGVTREFRFFGGRIEGTAAGLGVLDLGDVVLSLGSGSARALASLRLPRSGLVRDGRGGRGRRALPLSPLRCRRRVRPEADGGRFENRSGFGPFFLLGARARSERRSLLSPDPVLQPGSQYGPRPRNNRLRGCGWDASGGARG